MRWQQFNNREGTEARGSEYMEWGDWREAPGKVKLFTRGQPQALAWVHAKCRNKRDRGVRCADAELWWLWSNWDPGTDSVTAHRLSGKDGLEGKDWQLLSMEECSKNHMWDSGVKDVAVWGTNLYLTAIGYWPFRMKTRQVFILC